MFKKKPQIKNLSSLRSSDRRKRADQAISQYDIQVPSQTPAPLAHSQSDPPTPPAQTLSSIRNNLFPENCSSARFTTHAGPDNKLVSGAIFVGAHPGQEERILWFQLGADDRLYPTVYTLWQNPGLVPLLHTPGMVVEKLKTGADLMTPGLFGGPPWPERAKKNAIVAVANLDKPTVPVWVGVCEIDISSLGSVRGEKGKAIDGIHWAGDELYRWSSSSAITTGREAPDALQGWGDELADDRLAEDTAELDLADDDEDAQDNGGVSLDESIEDPTNGRDSKNDEEEDGDNREPTTQEVDDAFQQAFIYAVYNAKKHGQPPFYGLDLPGILPSYLVAKMIQPHLRSQSQHYTIKKTSWKTVKKFIKHLDKQKLIKSKDRNGGETVIQDIDFDDIQVKQFTPYRIPKPKADDGGASISSATNGHSSSQNLTLQHLFRASSKLVPDLVPSKTDYYTRSQILDYIRTYISNNPDLSTGITSKRFIKLNPFLANNVFSLESTASDAQILAAGEVARDVLSRRVLDDHKLCAPYWVLLKSDQTWDADDRSLPKPKSGASPKVTITVENRTGTKTVTRVTGLETFDVNPQTLAPELQKRCASSSSVEQAVGAKPGIMEIMVQGDQRDIVTTELAKRGVKSEWVEVVDKTKKKGGGGSSSGARGGRS